VVIENGQPIVVLKGFQSEANRLAYWKLREEKLGRLPAIEIDSTAPEHRA
jgi:hypothetical protein